MKDKATRVQEAIDAFNAEGRTEFAYGVQSRVYARKPILATDCDYEIVRVSGVQGMKLPVLYEEYIERFRKQYGDEGVYAFEALCLTAEDAGKLSASALDMKVQHALQDMGAA